MCEENVLALQNQLYVGGQKLIQLLENVSLVNESSLQRNIR